MNTGTYQAEHDETKTENHYAPRMEKSGQHKEGPVAKAIEKQTAKLPSDTFLWLALGAIGASLSFQVAGKKETSTFIGQWAPTLLILGLYNKLVKLEGSDPKPAHA